MPLVSTNQPNLINGVSQQADSLKFPTQAVEQINGYSSIVEGLIKRNPSRHVAKLTTATSNTPYIHTINRDSVERYDVIIQDSSIRVFTLDGVERSVATPHGVAYLSGASQSTMRAVTISDYTFILNKTKTCAMATATTAAATSSASVFIQQGAYSVTYTVGLGTPAGMTEVSYQSGTTAGAASTETIATGLAAAITGNSTLNSLYNVVVDRSLIYITIKSGVSSITSVSCKYADTVGNTYGKVANDASTTVANLPPYAANGQLVKITGGTDGVADDYWVKFVPDANVFYGTGKWKETVAPSIQYKIDESTLPHVLIRLSDGTFLFARADGSTQSGYALPSWGRRNYGTTVSNPDPSFIGGVINDITLFRGRLAFATGENIVLSEAANFFNFFRTTLQSLLDSDPIDVAVTSAKVSVIYNMVPFAEKLLLFSDQNQFSLTSADILTPKTVSIQQTTEFLNYKYTKPVNVGKTVHFPFIRGTYSGIMEYFVSPFTGLFDGVDITAPVSKYIVGNITKITASSNEQVVVALADGMPNGIYIYKYFYSGEEKIQSAWSKWVFDSGCTILNVDFVDSVLYLTIKRADGIYLEKINIEVGFKDTYSDFATRLDRRITETATGVSMTYNTTTDVTNVALPYSYLGTDTVQVVTRDASSSTSSGGKVLKVYQGNHAAYFNGNNQYLQASTSSYTQTGANSFSMTGWFRIDTLTPYTPIFSNADGDTLGGFELMTGYDGTKLLFAGAPVNGSYVMTPETSHSLVAGNWYFICAWFDSSDRKVYLSVYDQASTFVDSVSSSTGSTNLVSYTDGYTIGTSAQYVGAMDQVNFYSRVLTLSERNYFFNSGAGVSYFDIPSSLGPTNGLVAWWRMEEDKGTRFDSVGNINLADFGGVSSIIRTTNYAYNTITVQGDITSTPFYAGISYDMSYQFSTPLIRVSSGQSKVAVTDGRLQVKSGNITYNNSLYFSVVVTPKYRDSYTYKFTGPRLGTGGAVIGQEQLVSGAFKFPIMAKNDMVDITLHNDSPFPCALLSVDWESWYQTRNQRV